MCETCIYIAQWLGVNPGDMVLNINGIVYPAAFTVNGLVGTNSQFWFQPGINGQTTLTTVVTRGSDMVMVTNTGTYTAHLHAHPIHGPRR